MRQCIQIRSHVCNTKKACFTLLFNLSFDEKTKIRIFCLTSTYLREFKGFCDRSSKNGQHVSLVCHAEEKQRFLDVHDIQSLMKTHTVPKLANQFYVIVRIFC